MRGDHPRSDPGDGREECQTCGKWVFGCIHSCKGVPVTAAAKLRSAPCVPSSSVLAALDEAEDSSPLLQAQGRILDKILAEHTPPVPGSSDRTED